jgi:hypothetical protein
MKTKTRTQHWTWTSPIYGTEIHLWKCEPEALIRYVRKNHISDWKFEDQGKGIQGKHFLITGNSFPRSFIWLHPEWNPNRISSLSSLLHETFHATSRTLYMYGLELCWQSEEAFAYYQQWLFRKCLERLTA